MAKLEELVTPNELLQVMRGGALKNQVIKKYRTSEQELAMMLLPLYRSGDLSKEEFNDFFKGAPLTPKEAPPAEAPQVREDEPPSQILRSLSGGRSQPAAMEARPPSPAPADEVPEPVAADEQPPPRQPVLAEPELAERLEAVEAEEEEFLVEAEIVEETEFDEAALDALAEVEEVEGAIEPTEEKGATGKGVEHALEVIIAKLTSIDNRLATIEKKPKVP